MNISQLKMIYCRVLSRERAFLLFLNLGQFHTSLLHIWVISTQNSPLPLSVDNTLPLLNNTLSSVNAFSMSMEILPASTTRKKNDTTTTPQQPFIAGNSLIDVELHEPLSCSY